MRRRKDRALCFSAAAAVIFAVGMSTAPAAGSRPPRRPGGIPQGYTIQPVADSYVSSSKPRTNYGKATRLKAEQSPLLRGYLRFDIRDLAGPVTRASLLLYSTSKSSIGYDVRSVDDNTWQESTISYANAPPPSSSSVAASGPLTGGAWTTVDLTSLISGNGPVSIALTTVSNTQLSIASRESGTTAPLLVIETPTAPDTIQPSMPTNLSVTAATTTSLSVSWTASTDNVAVVGYDLYLEAAKAGFASTTSYTFSGLSCGTSYSVMVDAYDAAGNSSLPAGVVAATAPCADTLEPTPPSSLTVTGATSSSVSLFWGPSFDDVGVVGYNVYKNGNKLASTPGPDYTVSNLRCATAYALGVTAYDAAGNESPVTAVTASTTACTDLLAPTPPTNLTVTGTTATSISLSWSPSTDNVGVTGYGAYVNGSRVASVGTTSYTFSGLACGTNYALDVDAYDAAGNRSTKTSRSASTSACPSASGPQIKYRFAYSNGPDQSLMPQYGYNLIDVATKSEADATPPGTFGQVWLWDYDNTTCSWELDDATISARVSSMANDPKVAGFYFANESDPIKCPNAIQQHRQRNALIKSLAPTKYTILAVDSNWRDHFATQVPMWKGVADYLVYNPYICYVGKPCDFAWLDTVLKAAEANGNEYFVALQAFSEGSEWRWPTPDEERQMLDRLKGPSLSLLRGYMTFSWDWSNDALLNHPDVLQVIQDFNLGTSSSADTAAPTTPANFSKTGSTTTSVSLSWSASSDNVGVSGYNVYRNGSLLGSTAATSYTAASLACGTSYTFAVEAKDAAGNVSSSAGLTASTDACSGTSTDTTAPTIPAALSATGATTTSLSLSWGASTDNVGVSGYHIYRNGTLLASIAQTSYTFGGLTCGTSYTLAVDAYDAAGNRSAPASLTAATSPCPDAVAPTAPTNLTVISTAATGISVSWGASFDAVGVTGYDLFKNGTKVATTTGTNYSFGGLTCGTSYTLGVEAHDAAGNQSARTSVVAATSACPVPSPTDTQAPTAPSNLTKTGATETSIAVSWSASTDNFGVTGYNLYSNGTKVASTAGTSYSFGGLSCGTSYTLAVEAYDAAGNTSTRSTLTASTNACAPAAGDAVIAAAGDICSSPTDCAGTAKLLDAIAPTRVLTLGDNAYPDGSSSDYSSFYDPNWGRLKAKTSPAPGNHDYHTAGGAGYFAYFGSQAPAAYYSFDVGAWHLISLNGEIGISAGSAQETWLKSDLAAHPAKCTLAYWHEPRFSSGAEHGSNSSFDPFWRDLYAAGVDVVLNGHDHEYERFAPQNPSGAADANGIREFVVGTGGASHYTFSAAIANSEVRDNTSFGVLKLTLHSASYDWQFVPVAGASFTDSGSTSCH
jgi:acid phosphatase type 7